jgi:RNA polymerase sigma-70 factor (sigma-E family)
LVTLQQVRRSASADIAVLTIFLIRLTTREGLRGVIGVGRRHAERCRTLGGISHVHIRSRPALASDEEFEQFVAGALPRLLRFAHVLTGNSSAAEDLVQTALGRSWRAWRLGRIDDPQAFVRKVMVNSYASWHRRHGGSETAVANPPDRVLAEDEARRIDDRDAMRRALLALPARQRTVIVLRYYEELSEQEIAAVMGISPGTVKSQAARALRRLAATFTAMDPGHAGSQRSPR